MRHMEMNGLLSIMDRMDPMLMGRNGPHDRQGGNRVTLVQLKGRDRCYFFVTVNQVYT